MPMVIGELLVRLEASTEGLQKITKGMDEVAAKAQRAGQTLSVGLTVPLAAIGTAAIKMGMDAVEGENLFEVSMGRMADSARRWSQDLRRELGLNEYQLRQQVGTFNVMFGAMGIGEQAAYDMAKGLTQLAYDMSSFFNMQPEAAFEKLTGAMAGQVQPLRQLGIVINETTIEQYALNHGMIKQGEQLSEQGKILARYGAILEQTAVAQGDMARTLDSPANKLRILQEQIRQTSTEFGVALLPAFHKAMEAAKPLVDKLKDAVDWFANLSPALQENIIKWLALAAAIGPVTLAISQLIKVGGVITGVVGGIVPVVRNAIFAFGAWQAGAATLSEALDLAAGKLSFLFGPAGIVLAGISAIALWVKHTNDTIEAERRLQTQHESTASQLRDLRDRYSEISGQMDKLKPDTEEYKKLEAELETVMTNLGAILPNVTTATDNLAEARKRNLTAIDEEIAKEAALAAALERTALQRDQARKQREIENYSVEAQRWRAQGELQLAEQMERLKAKAEADLVQLGQRMALVSEAIRTGDYSKLVAALPAAATTAAGARTGAVIPGVPSGTSAAAAKAAGKTPEEVWREIIDELRRAQREMSEGIYPEMRMALARGDKWDWKAETAALIEDTIRALYSAGMTPEHNSMQWLVREYSGLVGGAGAGEDLLTRLGIMGAGRRDRPVADWGLSQTTSERQVREAMAQIRDGRAQQQVELLQNDLRRIGIHSEEERAWQREQEQLDELREQNNRRLRQEFHEMERAYQQGRLEADEQRYQNDLRRIGLHAEEERAWQREQERLDEAGGQASRLSRQAFHEMERAWQEEQWVAEEQRRQNDLRRIGLHADEERAWQREQEQLDELREQSSRTLRQQFHEMERAWQQEQWAADEQRRQNDLRQVGIHAEEERAWQREQEQLDQVHEQNNRKLIELFHERERAWQEEQWAAEEQRRQNDLRRIGIHAEEERAWQREQEQLDERREQNNRALRLQFHEMERAWQREQLEADELRRQNDLRRIGLHADEERAWQREQEQLAELNDQNNRKLIELFHERERAWQEEQWAAEEQRRQNALRMVGIHADEERAWQQEQEQLDELHDQSNRKLIELFHERERAWQEEQWEADEQRRQNDLRRIGIHAEEERAWQREQEEVAAIADQTSRKLIELFHERERAWQEEQWAAEEQRRQNDLRRIGIHAEEERAWQREQEQLDELHDQNNRKLIELFHVRERAWQEEQWAADEQRYQNALRMVGIHAEEERAWQREQEEAAAVAHQSNRKLIELFHERERAWQEEQWADEEQRTQNDLRRIGIHAEEERAWQREQEQLDQVHEQNNRKLIELFHQRERAWQEEQWAADEQKIQNDLRLITLHAERERQWQREQEEADELEYQNNLNLVRLHAEREREWQANQQSLWDRMQGAWQDTIKPAALARMPILNNALTAAKQAAPGGPEAMAVAVLTSLLVDSTQFAELLERINPLLQAAADVVGAFLEPFMPIVTVLSSALTPALRVLGHVAGSVLLPVMQALFPVFKGLGLVALGVTIAFGHAWNLLASIINKALGWLGVNLKLIDTGELGEAFEALLHLTWDQAAATEAATNAMYNVPHGFKIAMRRFEAATAEPWTPGGTGSAGSSRGISGGGRAPTATGAGVTVYVTGDVYGYDDFRRKVREAQATGERSMRLAQYGTAGV